MPEYPEISWGDPKMLDLVPQEKCIIKDGKRFPRVRALRKLIIDIVGPIMGEKTKISNFGFNSEIGFYGATTNKIVVMVLNQHFLTQALVGQIISAAAAADGTPENAGEGFSKFSIAMSDTRAKGRSYVNLLGLDINVAEELPSNNETVVKSSGKSASNSDRRIIQVNLERLFSAHQLMLDASVVCNEIGLNYDNITSDDVPIINSIIQKWIKDKTKIPSSMFKEKK